MMLLIIAGTLKAVNEVEELRLVSSQGKSEEAWHLNSWVEKHDTVRVKSNKAGVSLMPRMSTCVSERLAG